MKHLKDIVNESLLDDEDVIMNKAYDAATNPFLLIARTPREVCEDDKEFAKVLHAAEELIRKESKVVNDFKKTNYAKYKIAFDFQERSNTGAYRIILPPGIYIKYGRKTYKIQGESFTSCHPMTIELGSKAYNHFEQTDLYYIPSKKLTDQLIEYMEVAIEANKLNGDISGWNKYIGKI